MTIMYLLTSTWEWDPTILLGCMALLIGYVWLSRPLSWGRTTCYLSGVLILLVALVSPLDLLSDHYLFSAHMLQHLLLILVVPPLLLLGVRDVLADWRGKSTTLKRVEGTLSHPALAWLSGLGTIWIWHLPVLYNAALGNESIHLVEHLAFLVTSTIFWWPVLRKPKEIRMSPPAAIFYLMAAGFASTLLCVLLAFWPSVLYPTYVNPPDTNGLTFLIRRVWGLSARDDQQIAGMMMWVPGSFAYLLAVFIVLTDWMRSGEQETAPDALDPAAAGLVLKELP